MKHTTYKGKKLLANSIECPTCSTPGNSQPMDWEVRRDIVDGHRWRCPVATCRKCWYQRQDLFRADENQPPEVAETHLLVGERIQCNGCYGRGWGVQACGHWCVLMAAGDLLDQANIPKHPTWWTWLYCANWWEPNKITEVVQQVRKFGCLDWLIVARDQHWATWRLFRTEQQRASFPSSKDTYGQELQSILMNVVHIAESRGCQMLRATKPWTIHSTLWIWSLVSTHKM